MQAGEIVFHDWTVGECISEGSFGKVYKITRIDFGHIYEAALKVIEVPQDQAEVEAVKSEGLEGESVTMYFHEVVEDLVNEFVLMSKLKGNSNIVSYEDHSVVQKKDSFGWDIYIRMELLTPFLQYMKNHTLSVHGVIRMGIDICHALEICQRYNIIHRDIKPENIFVSEIGDFKLGDFGIARQLEKTSFSLSQKGTFIYMAPEVYKGQPYNSTVDIYSLGIVLYRYLNNNRSPFMPAAPAVITPSDREKAHVLRFSGESLPKPCNAEGRLAEIVLKACAYNPKDRYESASEMKRALQEILYSEREREVIYPDGDELENESVDYVSDPADKSNFESEGTILMFGSPPEEEKIDEKIKDLELAGDNSTTDKARQESHDVSVGTMEQGEIKEPVICQPSSSKFKNTPEPESEENDPKPQIRKTSFQETSAPEKNSPDMETAAQSYQNSTHTTSMHTLEEYEEELSISQKLYETRKTLQSAQDYSLSCNNVGDIYEKQGRLEEALEKYEEGLLISRKLNEKQKSPESAKNYSISCDRVGDIYRRQGRLEEALEKYEEGLAISRKLNEKQQSPENARDHIIRCNRLGAIYFRCNRLRAIYLKCNMLSYEHPGALEESQGIYEEGLSICRKLYEEQPLPENARNYSINCRLLGDIYKEQGRLDEALERYEEGQPISRKLYEEQQTSESAWSYYVSCCKVGDIYKEQGRLDEALERYEEGLSISQIRIKMSVNDSRHLLCEIVGDIYKKQERPKEALKRYEENLSIRRELEEYYYYTIDTIDSCNKVGDIYEEQGRLKEAQEIYEEGLSICRKLYEKQEMPESYDYSCNRLGLIYRLQGKLDKAQEVYEEGLSICRKWYKEQPTSKKAMRRCRLSCINVGNLYEEQGKLDEALEIYEEALLISEKLYEGKQTLVSEDIYYKDSCCCIKRIQRKVNLISIFNNAAQKKYTKKISIPELYFLNSLQEKQICNILKYCAKGLVKEDIIVFCGTKFFSNNGKRGYVFTDKGIYADDSIYKYVKGKKIDLPILYSDIEKCEYEEQYSSHVKCILTDGRQQYLYTDIYSQFFCEIINEITNVFSVYDLLKNVE